MYHLVTGLYAEWTRKERFNVLMLGLSGVGKSCLLEKLKSIYLHVPALPPSRIAPTVGQNVFTLTLPSSQLHFWDLGGSASVRSLWRRYFEESHALVWVVDAGDFADLAQDGKGKGKGKATEASERREESWKTLAGLLAHPSLEGLPLLILANKVDAHDSDQIAADTHKIKAWFEAKMHGQADDAVGTERRMDEDVGNGAKSNLLSNGKDGLSSADGYEWDVLATSAIEGTGIQDAVDWLYVRVQNNSKR